jgi:hypothetical protein
MKRNAFESAERTGSVCLLFNCILKYSERLLPASPSSFDDFVVRVSHAITRNSQLFDALNFNYYLACLPSPRNPTNCF